MRDSDGRLLGTVTTLEDVTSLQDTDRFNPVHHRGQPQAARSLAQAAARLYALNQGFGGELQRVQVELAGAASYEAEKLDDLMGDLIEVAELDTGKREFKLERLARCRRWARRAIASATSRAQSASACKYARLRPLGDQRRPPCAPPFWTTSWPTRSGLRRRRRSSAGC